MVGAASFGAAAAALLAWTPRPIGFDADEAATMTAVRMSLGSITRLAMTEVDAVHWLYYLIARASFAVLGPSEFAMRLPSAVAVGIAVCFTVLIGARLWTPPLGYAAGVLVAAAPMTQQVVLHARGYACAMAATTVLTYVLLRAAAAPAPRRRWWWLGYLAAAVVAVGLFAYVAVLVAVHAAWMTALHLRKQSAVVLVRYATGGGIALVAVGAVGLWLGTAEAARHAVRDAATAALTVPSVALAFAVLALATAWWFGRRTAGPLAAFCLTAAWIAPLAAAAAGQHDAVAWTSGHTLTVGDVLVRPYFLDARVPAAACWAVILTGLTALAARLGRDARQADDSGLRRLLDRWASGGRRDLSLIALIAAWAVVPPVAIAVLHGWQPAFDSRFFAFCVPGLALLTAWGLRSVLRRGSLVLVGALVLAALSVPAVSDLKHNGNYMQARVDYNVTADYVAAHARPDDGVVPSRGHAGNPWELPEKGLVAYREQYAGLADLTLVVRAEDRNAFDDRHVDAFRDRRRPVGAALRGTPADARPARIWFVRSLRPALAQRERVRGEARAIESAGYRAAEVVDLPDTRIVLFRRP